MAAATASRLVRDGLDVADPAAGRLEPLGDRAAALFEQAGAGAGQPRQDEAGGGGAERAHVNETAGVAGQRFRRATTASVSAKVMTLTVAIIWPRVTRSKAGDGGDRQALVEAVETAQTGRVDLDDPRRDRHRGWRGR